MESFWSELASHKPDQKKLLKSAVIHYAEYLDTKGNRSKAKEVLEAVKEFYADDAEFKGALESY